MTTVNLVTAKEARMIMASAKSLRATIERDVRGAAGNGKHEAIFYVESIDGSVLQGIQDELQGRGFSTLIDVQEDGSVAFIVNWELPHC
nr:MAG TPA: hypothetical protein [Caudoviricetes sp.]